MPEHPSASPKTLVSNLVPLDSLSPRDFDTLLEEEIAAWREVLSWDYRRTAQLVREYAGGGLIQGVGLLCGELLAGYGYYLLREGVGSIGAVFASPARTDAVEGAGLIFSSMLRLLRVDPSCQRIEGQLFQLAHSWHELLEAEGLQQRRRHYMRRTLDLDCGMPVPELKPWDNDHLPEAARLLFLAYCEHADRELSAAYQNVRSCSQFLRNLVLAPGCGEFLPSGSFIHVDPSGQMGGFVLSSQIARRTALIPQICVRPDLQGRRIGSALLERACVQLKAAGYRQLFLCVTAENESARNLYLRHGFADVQEFQAFYWNRIPPS